MEATSLPDKYPEFEGHGNVGASATSVPMKAASLPDNYPEFVSRGNVGTSATSVKREASSSGLGSERGQSGSRRVRDQSHRRANGRYI